jgi:hypothetical protein
VGSAGRRREDAVKPLHGKPLNFAIVKTKCEFSRVGGEALLLAWW